MRFGYLSFVLLVFSLPSVAFSQETLTCRVIDECRSDDGTCETGSTMSFQILVSTGKETARIVTPEVDAVLNLASDENGLMIYKGEMNENPVNVTLDTEGNFDGLRTSGSGVEFRLRATCGKASG